MRQHATEAAAGRADARKVAAHRRRRRLSALSIARERWSLALAVSAADVERASKRRKTAQDAARRYGFIGRDLTRAWRRWRAKMLVEDARMIRTLAALGVASKQRKQRGLAAMAARAASD